MSNTKRLPGRFFHSLLKKYSKYYRSFAVKKYSSVFHPSNLKKHHQYTLWENPFKLHKVAFRIALLLLPFLIFSLYHIYTLAIQAAVNASYEVVVVGGGTGGVSAAVQAARQGVRVALVESTDWLGGQAAAAAVSNMDEGANERSSGIYNEFVTKVAAKYGGLQYIHKCYFSGNGICPEPHIVKQVFEEMVSGTGRVDVYYRNTVTSVLKSGNTVTGITTHSTVDNATNQLNAKVVVDATEYGDVIPLAGVAYRIGSQNSGSVNTAACVQDITYTAVVKRYDNGIPSNLRITTPPPGYNSTVESRFVEMVTSTNPQNNGSAPYYWSWTRHSAYRGMADSSRPSTTDAGSNPASLTKTGINFANDYPAERPYNNNAGNTKLSVSYIENPTYRAQANCEAKLKAIQFIYYMQKSGQNWSVADDEGFDTSYNQSENSCSNIPAAYKEIEKRLPLMPYVRESRRIVGITTYTSSQLRAQKQSTRTDGTSVKAVNFSSSIAVGGYDDDLHNCNDASTLDSSIDAIGDKGMGGGTFQIPFETLIPQTIDGFLAAEKNISQSRLVNGATRLQPSTMLTGQAAGALAAIAAQSGRQPRNVKPIEVQIVLANAKSYLALAQFNDVTPDNAYFTGVQISSIYNVFFGDGAGNFNTGGTVSRGTAAILMCRLLNIPYNGTEDDAITQIRARGLSTASSNSAYNAGGALVKGDLAIMLARSLGQRPGNADQAISYLSSRSISVECGGGGCSGDTTTRGIFANAAAYTLKAIAEGFSTQPVDTGAAASNLVANVQASQVSLSWTPSSGKYINQNASDNDHIQVFSNPDFTGTKVLDGGVGAGTTSWTIPVNNSGSYNSVQPGKTYYARVYSWNAPCNCSDGTTTSFTIPGTVNSPAPAITNAGIASQYNPWVVWGIVSNVSNSITVRLYDNNGAYWANGNGVAVNTSNGNISFELPSNNPPSNCNRSNSCTIFFDVVNADTQSSNRYSLSLSQFGSSSGSGEKAATNLTANASTSHVALSWSPSSGKYTNREFSDHDHIQVFSNSNFTGTKVLDGGVGSGTTSWSIPVNNSGSYNSVQPGKTYYARVYSWNAPCNCSDGTTTSFTVPGSGASSDNPASNLQASVQSSQVRLTWTSSTGSYMNREGSDGDHIQVYSNSNYTGTKVLDGGVGGGTTSWSIPVNNSGSYNSVQPGKTYYARVYSWNAPCNCSNGTSVSFTVNGSNNDHPAQNLQANVQSSQVVLSWISSTGAYTNREFSDHDHIQVFTNANFTGEKVLDGGTGAGTTSWTIPVTNSGSYNSLRSGTTYYARIYSFNAPCNCSDGTTISFRTQ